MPLDGNARPRAPFLQTPEALIDNPALSDASVRLLQAMVKLPPRNARNSDAVARSLHMGKDKTNSARKSLATHGHWHSRKRQDAEGQIRDQRLASLVPLRNSEEIAAGWAAAEEAARLGKDTAESRLLGVRLLNSAAWQRNPAAGHAEWRPTRRRPPGKDHTGSSSQTPLPVPAAAGRELPRTRRELPEALRTELEAFPLTGPDARFARDAERALLRLRWQEPRLTLPPAEAQELAQLAGHHLLRGTTSQDLLTTLTQGLPADGVRCPAAFVRTRLVRYMPPLPPYPQLPGEKPPEPPVRTVRTAADAPVRRPDGPAEHIAAGGSWRDICPPRRTRN